MPREKKSIVDISDGQKRRHDEYLRRVILADKKARDRNPDGTFREDRFPFNTKKKKI